MHNRNIISRFFLPVLLVVSVVSFIACNDSAEKDADIIQENNKQGNNKDTLQSNPYSLSASDLADDSVFSNGSKPVSWENAGVTDPVAMKTFVRKLQVWVRDNYVDSIAP